jgi:hypothetical protein
VVVASVMRLPSWDLRRWVKNQVARRRRTRRCPE